MREKRLIIVTIAIAATVAALALLHPYLSPFLSELFPVLRERPSIEVIGELYGSALIADQPVEWRFTRLRGLTSQAATVIVEVEGVLCNEVEAVVVGFENVRFVRGISPLYVALNDDEFVDEVRVKAVLPPRAGRVLVSVKAKGKGYERVEADVRDVILREEAKRRDAERFAGILAVVLVATIFIIGFLLYVILRQRQRGGGW